MASTPKNTRTYSIAGSSSAITKANLSSPRQPVSRWQGQQSIVLHLPTPNDNKSPFLSSLIPSSSTSKLVLSTCASVHDSLDLVLRCPVCLTYIDLFRHSYAHLVFMSAVPNVQVALTKIPLWQRSLRSRCCALNAVLARLSMRAKLLTLACSSNGTSHPLC